MPVISEPCFLRAEPTSAKNEAFIMVAVLKSEAYVRKENTSRAFENCFSCGFELTQEVTNLSVWIYQM